MLIVAPKDQAAPGLGSEHAHDRGVPDGGSGPVPGRRRHHVAQHHAGPHQPRLRRREVRHDRRRARPHGHRPRHRGRTARSRRPRRPSRRRCWSRRSTEPRACCSPSPARPTSRSTRSTRRPTTSPASRIPTRNIIFGAVVDDALGEEVRVTVVAAGPIIVANGRNLTIRNPLGN